MQKKVIHYIYFPSLAIIMMWLAKTAEYILHIDFKSYGNCPRKLDGLIGIVTSPFIHADFNHLISNTFPFFFLSVAIFYFYRNDAVRIILYSWFITETAVWIGARSACHIGASGLVYAFASFLFFSGILSKDRRLAAISLLVIFLYGGMIWGIFPTEYYISWESHLFGFITGFIVAFYYGKPQSISQIGDDENDDEFKEQSSTHEKEYDVNYNYNEKE